MEASMYVCVAVAFLFLLGPYEILGSRLPSKKLLLISFDGLRWDYEYRRPDLTSFRYLRENGVKAEYLMPPYPSMTSPSHTTIATGLYPESHGVVHNVYYNRSNSADPVDSYYTTLAIPEWWNTGYEPIWSTAATQGLKSAVYLYPGSNMTVNGKSASYSYHPNEETEKDWTQRIDRVVKWFKTDGYDFVAAYFPQPDNDGHDFGPQSSVIADRTLPLVDQTITHLLQSINKNGLKDELNIIFVSDHGMLQLDQEAIPISNYVDPSDVYFKLFYGAIGLIEPVPGKKDKVYSDIKNANLSLQIFYKEEMPKRFHFAKHDRITSLVLIAFPQRVLKWNTTSVDLQGNHAGFDNMLPGIRSSFYMIGPSFKKNFTIPGFESIHIYELMCKLLNLRPAPNNGSLEVLSLAVKENGGVVLHAHSVIFLIVLFITAYCVI